MGRGRPKGSKNRPKDALIFLTNDSTKKEEVKTTEKTLDLFIENKDLSEDNINTTEEKIIENKVEKPRKIVCTCDKCGKDIYSSPVVATLSSLTGKATWHRECSLERIRLCDSCGKELNDLIDNWILKDHPEYKKFEISQNNS